MEIDLNNDAGEVEKNACGAAAEGFGSSSNSSSPLGAAANSSSIYKELWHACAGPLTSLPKKGNVVVYFPQGHLEQFSSVPPNFGFSPQICCKVVDVQLLANKDNDEVYTQLTLLPLPESEERIELDGKENGETEEEDEGGSGIIITSEIIAPPHMFCKTLTASDTSTHGGFSVPRRAAEDCFPPLDYKQQRPSQELVAKDLHGIEWKFRHIYRGQPRRHLLTTGWSIFVGQKNLVSGDAVLFLRGDGGELRLGIRRAVRPRNGLPDYIVNNQSTNNLLSLAATAVSSNTTFNVFYSPRAGHASYVIPYHKYVKSISHHIPIGLRFKVKFDVDDSTDRSGVVMGVGDLDPYRWPNSKWRCLMVRWDEEIMSDRQERISPWEIDPSISLPPLSSHSSSSSPRLMKKLRAGMQTTALPDNTVSVNAAAAGSFLDFEESSVRPSQVLQGQENAGLISPLYGCDKMSRHRPLGVEMMHNHHQQPIVRQNHHNVVADQGNVKYGEFLKNHHHRQSSTPFAGFMESTRFPKVLQGQEICSLKALADKNEFKLGLWGRPPEVGSNFFNVYKNNNDNSRPNSTFYPLASEGMRNGYFPYNNNNDIYKAGGGDPLMLSRMINFGSRQNVPFIGSSVQGEIIKPNEVAFPTSTMEILKNGETADAHGSSQEGGGGCKLFGFSLTGGETPNSQSSNKRSCTKVHKQGNLVGRAIDLSRLNSYSDLLIELERLFGMDGLLCDPEKGWRILYTDSENDMMVVGDDPWNEFCSVVSKIHIHTQEEVDKMTIGVVISDDTQSCLEEAQGVVDVSKSSA
ncbi:auxin response factor 4 isoform X2 [Impatiens glandulifera]|uniref:auxin response factor 4 isoform X2 n=1 Tax=Impatiens glandulifera TaxID=253017 RepID=UPI001FB05337|nr:auxin response factor 4 isoform X2 [Impatiens glandulifera]